MLFLFLLSLKFNPNSTSYTSIVEKSQKTPVFLLMYSPHCGHCLKVHPVWEEFTEKMAKDPGVIIGEIDCVAHRDECKSIFAATGWPTFLYYVKGKPYEVKPTRTVEGFIEKANELKTRDFSISCLSYPGDAPRNIYPYFVYSTSEKNTRESCDDVQRINTFLPDVTNKLLHVQNATSSYYFVQLSATTAVNYTGAMTIPAMVKWTKDWLMTAFGQWKLEEGFITSRKLAFLVVDNVTQTFKFRKSASDLGHRALVGKIILEDLKKSFPELNITTPGLILVSNNKAKFQVVDSIQTTDKFETNLKAHIAGKTEDDMNFEITKLFGKQVPRGVAHALIKHEKRERKLATRVVTIVVGAGLIIAIIVVAFITMFMKNESKIE